MSGPRREGRRRLRRADFLRATRRGRRLEADYFRVFVLERGGDGSARLGITVTRKVGNAVHRNRIKRLVREWFRRRGCGMGPCDVIVIAKEGFPAELSQQEVQVDLDRGLACLVGRGSSS